MEAGERREQLDLREKINRNEDLLSEYADCALMFANVEVEIRDFEDARLVISDKIKSSFENSNVHVRSIRRVDLGLSYDRAEQFFKINRAALHFDNKYVVEFAQSPKLSIEKLYYYQVLNPDKKVASKSDNSSCLPEEYVHEILDDCGLIIPSQPERAEWSSIEQILLLTRNWESRATHTVAVEPYPNKQLIISDHVVSNNPEFDQEFGLLDSALIRELSAGIEETQNFEETPKSCLKFIVRSDALADKPTFKRVERVPVKYEPPFGGMPPTQRTEFIEEAQLLNPNAGIIDSIFYSLDEAYNNQFKLT